MKCQAITAALNSLQARAIISSSLFGIGTIAAGFNIAFPIMQQQKAADFGDLVLDLIAKNSTSVVQNISREYSKLTSDVTSQAVWSVAMAILVPVCVWGTTRFCSTCNGRG